ncbi:MAG: hypothetical protein P1V20_00540 [Verrucomicrobiales bacterium]|nr:hypothetical protein [Verrucomicrobiales bacterium]
MKGLIVAALAFLFVGRMFALEYEKDIMPFLSEKCGECHSKSGKAKGGLKLDDPRHFYGRFEKNSVVVPGDWDASLLFITLFRPADHKDAMPPEGKGERLTPEETRMVQQWIADGAPIAGKSGETGPMPKKGDAGYIEAAGEPAPEMTAEPVEENWTNTQGKTIRATLIRVEGGKAWLKMKNGTVHKYPVNLLSEESRARLSPE